MGLGLKGSSKNSRGRAAAACVRRLRCGSSETRSCRVASSPTPCRQTQSTAARPREFLELPFRNYSAYAIINGMKDSVSCLLCLAIVLQSGAAIDPAVKSQQILKAESGTQQKFLEEFSAGGIQLDLEKGQLQIEAEVIEAQMPLEYLIVGNKGATHESLFVAAVKPSLLTTALYLLSLKPGKNVEYRDKSPLPTPEQIAQGVVPYEVIAPNGDGVYLYAQWKEGEEMRRYRVEDLICNTKTGRAAARVQWIFLGSRMLSPRKEEPESFAADWEENIASICYFATGNQILTNPDLDGQEQHLFFPNRWLLPEKGKKVQLIFTTKRLEN